MFNGVGWGEVAVLLVIGLFVFGPDRLPKAARDAGRMLRQLRQTATGMRNDLRSELGPEFDDLDIRDLHPKTFVRKHLFDDEPLPPYLTKRTSLDALLLGDDTPSPSLTKSPPPGRAQSLPSVTPAPAVELPSAAGSGARAENAPPPAVTSPLLAKSSGSRPGGGGAAKVIPSKAAAPRPVSTQQLSAGATPPGQSRLSGQSSPAVPFDSDAT
ncbi:Sec-independent protein translocase protein TatB [Frankia sp. R82]|uniref:Sec-independent protein translocase protein TatB n=1 Tax=Frankia sp. R82 TaxID=2950553 RepID=UPI0020449CA0|nr:Sec-independent protein translocase protein TatB [Frankia sp. R82]MCM3884690.1 Sec-independent protein translocase protein TatB [Frankia sp. R82]